MKNTFVNKDTNEVLKLGNYYGDNFSTGFGGNVYDKDYICPTITTGQGGGRTPMFLVDLVR